MRLRHAVPFTLITGIAAVACAVAAMAPELSVMKAAAELGEAPRATYTLSVRGDKEALLDFNDRLVAVGSEEAATAEDIEDTFAFLNSRVSLFWDEGDDPKGLKDDTIALRADVDGMDQAVEIRYVRGTLYGRADVRRLAERFGGDLAGIDKTLQDAKATGFGFLDTAADGGWLAHDLDPIVSFLQGMMGNGAFEDAFEDGAGFALSDLRPEALQDVVDSFSEIYGNDVDVTKGKADGPGDHYILSAAARDLYEGLKPTLEGMPFLADSLEDLPGGGEIPEERLSADVWIKGGKITRMEFNLSQIAGAVGLPEGLDVPRITLRLDIDRSPARVGAPENVTELDVFELIGNLARGAGFES
jgi:hypothetical protein